MQIHIHSPRCIHGLEMVDLRPWKRHPGKNAKIPDGCSGAYEEVKKDTAGIGFDLVFS